MEKKAQSIARQISEAWVQPGERNCVGCQTGKFKELFIVKEVDVTRD